MKLKRLLINVLLIGGVTLSSCASYSSSDTDDVYLYILDKGLDTSNWQGLKFTYKNKYNLGEENENTKLSIKVTNKGGVFKALFSLDTKYTYERWDNLVSGSLSVDFYSESDHSYIKVKEDNDKEHYHFRLESPLSYGVSLSEFMWDVNYYLDYLLNIIEDAFTWSKYDTVDITGSVKESSNGANIKFSAAYLYNYFLLDERTYKENYTDSGKNAISLQYDKNFFVKEYSIKMEYKSNSDWGVKDKSKLTISASEFNGRISTPSWAK